ncbi:MAG: SDR family oxidoreductase [Burkholderiales bacterium]|nr:MAG: SDR family oxidoreductase [Burkholderiales bacterium]
MPDRDPFVDFGGRWVVVSGASSGIGRAAAIELAQHGARVALIGRNKQRLADTAAQLGGAVHHILALDLARHDAIAAEIGRLHEQTGPIYGLCHAAGVVATRPLQANRVEVVQAQLDVNLLAGLELARVVCRRDLMTPDGGSLLFVSSVYGRVGMPGQIGYCATKGAIAAAVRAMAIELARRNIRVNCLSPGLVRTEMTEQALGLLSPEHVQKLEAAHPLGAGRPEDVARAAVFLLAPGTRWITGADLAVDGGFTAQ